jgi:hypothetical protein
LTKFISASALWPLLAIVALLVAHSSLGADEVGTEVAKPAVKVGDRWTYRRTDYYSNKIISTFENRVASTGPDEILVISKRRGSTNESDSFYTSEWNAMTLGGLTLIPRADLFRFPLKVGASRETTYETVNKGSPARSKYELTIKVVGWEEITVPAGKFRALKMEAKGIFTRLDQRFGGGAWIEFWYVPEVKRWVKYTYKDGTRGPDNPYTTIGDELVEFSVQ